MVLRRHDPAGLEMAHTNRLGPHQRDVTCLTWDGDQQGDGYGATSHRRFPALSQRGSEALVLLLGGDFPGSLGRSPGLSFCPECYAILPSLYQLSDSAFHVGERRIFRGMGPQEGSTIENLSRPESS
jgi:hypothetical protein